MFFELPLLWEGVLFFCFDLGRVFLQGDTMLPLHYFLELSLVWERALCFCFDLARVFLQAAPCPNYTPNFFPELSVLVKGHYASASTWPWYLFRVNYGTPTPKFFFLDLSL